MSYACMLNIVATTWVEMYHGFFVNNVDIQKENEDIQMSAIKVTLNPLNPIHLNPKHC
jgi:hypothetical protein